MKSIKFCIFSDYHYWTGNYPNKIEPMRKIVEAAHDNNVDFMIQCGDLCHNSTTSPELDIYLNNKYNIPNFNCLGNHELEASESLESVCKRYGMKNNYESIDFKGFRIIILDTNYFVNRENRIQHQSPMTWGQEGPMGYLGDEQIEWLEKQISSSRNPCLIVSHDSMSGCNSCDSCSPEAVRVRNIIENANKKKKGSVLLCCNGHYHENSMAVLNNVVYFNCNATFNVHWQPTPIMSYPESFRNSARMAAQCCYSKNPLYAIVTVCDDGHIVIDGEKSEYLFKETIPDSICADPNILSAEVKLKL